jgi:hypothetical protein
MGDPRSPTWRPDDAVCSSHRLVDRRERQLHSAIKAAPFRFRETGWSDYPELSGSNGLDDPAQDERPLGKACGATSAYGTSDGLNFSASSVGGAVSARRGRHRSRR